MVRLVPSAHLLLHEAVEVVKAHALPGLARLVAMLKHRRDLLVGHRLAQLLQTLAEGGAQVVR
jgi:hypothetical protein